MHVATRVNQLHLASLAVCLRIAMSTNASRCSRSRSAARYAPLPLSPGSLRDMPTEVLRLHLSNLRLVTTGQRAALVQRLRAHLRTAGDATRAPSARDSDPSGPESSGSDSDSPPPEDPEADESKEDSDHDSDSPPPEDPDEGEEDSDRDSETDPSGTPPSSSPPDAEALEPPRARPRTHRHTAVPRGPEPHRRSATSRRRRDGHSLRAPPDSSGDRPRHTTTSRRRHDGHSLRAPPDGSGDHRHIATSRHRRDGHSRRASPDSSGDHRRSATSAHRQDGQMHRAPPGSPGGARRRGRQRSPSSSRSSPCSSSSADSHRHRRPRKRRRYSSTSSTSTTSSSSPHRHHRHGHRRRHRDSSEDWAPPSGISCAPPLSRRLSHRIRRGKYVRFESLLLPSDTPPVTGLGPTKSRAHRSRDGRKVSDLASWLEAWNRYICSRLNAHPALALELAKYQTLVAMLFAHYPVAACLRYDRLFRQAASQDASIRWDALREDIYVWSFTRHSSPPPSPPRPTARHVTARQSFRDRPPVISRLGPPPNPGHTPRLTTGPHTCHPLSHRPGDLPPLQLRAVHQGRRVPVRPCLLDPRLPRATPRQRVSQAVDLSSSEPPPPYDGLNSRWSCDITPTRPGSPGCY